MEIFYSTRSFFNSLLSQERKTFKNFIKMHERKNENGLSVKLFEFLSDYPHAEHLEVLVYLYGENTDKNESAFRKLLERFRDRMYESHCLDVNLFNREVASPYFSGIMEAKKMISLILAVIARGVSLKEENRLFTKGINSASQFELYDELTIILKLKLLRMGYNYGFYKQSKLYEDINQSIRNSEMIFQAGSLFNRFITDLQLKSIDDSTIKNEIKDAANKCKEIFDQSALHTVFYFWKSLEMQYCHYNKDYLTGEVLQKELLAYILKEPSLYQHVRIVDNYLNLSRTQTYLYRFDDALKNVYSSLNFVINNVYIENFIKEEIALLLMYKKEYKKAIELLKIIISNGTNSANPFLSKRQYFLAVAEFLNGDYKASFFSLQDTAELEDDKDGWNIGVRMLQIILTLQTEKIDLADKKIENLRKHIERTIKMKSIRKRDIVIFRLLSHLSRSGFDFKEVWEDRQKDFKLLRSDDPDYYWVPRSHELILFDQWFESKVKNVPYDPKFPDPVE